jgi:hypothetical protein
MSKSMHSAGEGLYFGTLPDGSVRILQFIFEQGIPPEADGVYSEGVLIDRTLPFLEWLKIVEVLKGSRDAGQT